MDIKNITEGDRAEITDMMREFYSSPAVMSSGSDEIFNNDITNCINSCPYLEGYIFKDGEKTLGYAMAAKSYSTEFGKMCIWIEDIYIKSECRGMGIGSEFFKFIERKYPDALFRLEAEEDNEGAVRMYRRIGYKTIPYMEMIKNI